MAPLTEKDYEILDFILEQQRTKGYPPTVREICTKVGLTSTATIHSRLSKLEKHGFLVKESTKKRSMRVVNYKDADLPYQQSVASADDRYLDVPVYGRVTAGMPILAVEEHEETFPLPLSFAKNKDIFMLRVQGESMINAAILDGDLIIVERQPNASNGDIVVAMIDGENATVKTFYKENGHFRLQPENDSMDPIIVEQVEILGKVVGVFRKL